MITMLHMGIGPNDYSITWWWWGGESLVTPKVIFVRPLKCILGVPLPKYALHLGLALKV